MCCKLRTNSTTRKKMEISPFWWYYFFVTGWTVNAASGENLINKMAFEFQWLHVQSQANWDIVELDESTARRYLTSPRSLSGRSLHHFFFFFFNTEIADVRQSNHYCIWQWLIHPAYSIALLLMAWWHKEPGHQQQWNWLWSPITFHRN